MLKLNILNLDNFLETVNDCTGPVYRLCPDGKKENFCRSFRIQDELRKEYDAHRAQLPIQLEVPVLSDYMHIVSYYAGDC